MKFICKQYPQLTIHDLQVEFKNGEYETTDKKLIGKLKKLEFIEVVDGEETEETEEEEETLDQ